MMCFVLTRLCVDLYRAIINLKLWCLQNEGKMIVMYCGTLYFRYFLSLRLDLFYIAQIVI